MMTNKSHPGLEAVIRRGARRHPHHYGRMFRSVAPAAAVTAAVNAAICVLVLTAAGCTDWDNIIVGASGAAIIPTVAISLLMIMTRRDHPVTVALAATAFAGSLVIALLSATRTPISGLLPVSWTPR